MGLRDNAAEHLSDHTPAVKLARGDHLEKDDKRKSAAQEEIKKGEVEGQSQSLPDPGQTHTHTHISSHACSDI